MNDQLQLTAASISSVRNELELLLWLSLQPRHKHSVCSSSSHAGEEAERVFLGGGFSFKTIMNNKWMHTG